MILVLLIVVVQLVVIEDQCMMYYVVQFMDVSIDLFSRQAPVDAIPSNGGAPSNVCLLPAASRAC